MPARARRKTFRSFGSKIILSWFIFASFLVLLFGGLVRIGKAWEDRFWKGSSRFTVAVVNASPYLFSYQEGVGLTRVEISPDIQVSAIRNLGEWRLGSLYELGELKGEEGKIFTGTLQSVLGIPIDGWLTGGQLNDILFGGKTNLAYLDRLKLAWVVWKTPTNSRIFISVKNEESVGLVKGAFSQNLVDLIVSRERIGVGIVNSSGGQGVGRKAGRIVEGLGAPVLWIKTGDQARGRCEVRVSQKQRESATNRRILRIFGCSEVVVADEKLNFIELVLGKEIAPDFP